MTKVSKFSILNLVQLYATLPTHVGEFGPGTRAVAKLPAPKIFEKMYTSSVSWYRVQLGTDLRVKLPYRRTLRNVQAHLCAGTGTDLVS
jgi:hypothetical protein